MFWLALIPILLILALMVGWGWSAVRAGGAGYLIALLIAAVFFKAGPRVLAYAHARAVFLAADVLLIIWGAFLFYRVVAEAGGIEVIGELLPRLTADRVMQALLIGWAFASFLQGVGGFGVPVAVTAPLLIGLGFPPLQAVVLPSLGHSWAVTFGSLGSSFNAMMAAVGLPWQDLAGPSALILGAACLGVGFGVTHLVGRWEGIRRFHLPVLLMGSAMAGGQYLAATSGLWNLGGLVGGSVGLLVGTILAWRWGRKPSKPAQADRRWGELGTALSGYVILIALTLAVQLVDPLHELLGRLVIGLDFPPVRTGLGYVTPGGKGRELYLLRHAGTILAASGTLSFFLFSTLGWYEQGAAGRILSSAYQRLVSSSVGITAVVMMAVIMSQAGMTDQLARGISAAVGGIFPALSPWLGALGAFMTGSNTNSNLIFSLLQMRTAEVLGVPVVIILAAQTSGGALGSVVAPTKVIVGASTAEMAGEEGLIMRALLPYIALLLLLVSMMTVLGVIWL